jgi:hypothetical protein
MMPGRQKAVAVCAALLLLPAGACTIDRGGMLLPDLHPDDGSPDKPVEPDDGVPDVPDDREETPHDPFVDAEIIRPEEPVEEDISDIVEADEEEPEPACGGVRLDGFCWYLSASNGSCTAACADHGGCNLAGTRDYAGSGGTDDGCRRVLRVLGLGDWQHFDQSNNDLGCQYAWNIYTYWSTYFETTCEAYPIIGANNPNAIRMCACER